MGQAENPCHPLPRGNSLQLPSLTQEEPESLRHRRTFTQQTWTPDRPDPAVWTRSLFYYRRGCSGGWNEAAPAEEVKRPPFGETLRERVEEEVAMGDRF